MARFPFWQALRRHSGYKRFAQNAGHLRMTITRRAVIAFDIDGAVAGGTIDHRALEQVDALGWVHGHCLPIAAVSQASILNLRP